MRAARLPRLRLVEPVARAWDRSPFWLKGLVILGLLAFLIIYPAMLPRFWQSVLFFPVGIYILLALGLNVVVGQAGLLDLGYVAFYAVGAYTGALLTTTLEWGSWQSVVPAIVVAMLSGAILGAPTLRLRGDYLAIVTLGFGEIVRIIANNTEPLGKSQGILNIPHPEGLLGIEFGLRPLPYYYLTLAAIILSILLAVALNRSRVGRAWVAIREDEDAAEAMGVPTFKMKLWAFTIGASTGGLGGWLYASRASFVNPDNFTLFRSIFILCAVVLGGMGSIPGVIAGGFVIGFLPEYLRKAAAGDFLTGILNTVLQADARSISEYRVLLFGLTLIVMMIFRPQGLIPSRRRAAELSEASPTGALATGAVSEAETITKEQATGGSDV
jgi:branched-chain amino acid transport system permease protein